MATGKICIATLLLSIHLANSYILLTANLEDVHALAKQIASSPVANQLNKIIRRATDVFNQQYSKGQIQLRSDPNLDEVKDESKEGVKSNEEVKGDENKDEKKEVQAAELEAKSPASSSEVSAENNDIKPNVERRHQVGPDLVALGKNASFYLKSIKKIFENV